MNTVYYSEHGEIVNVNTYPDFSKTKYKNFPLEISSKRKPNLYDRKEDCCGCFACYSICPANAIEMVEDLEGFRYPVIDLRICKYCYSCENVCPIKCNKS